MLARRLAVVLSLFLLLEGVWGLFSPVVFGVLTTNRLHAMIHIILAIAGFLAARSGRASLFLRAVGALLLVVGVLRFAPGLSGLIVSLLNVNVAVAWLNIVVGAIALAVGFAARIDGANT